MDNRKYNIFFHLHTVSGIVVSVALFVIFFAGSLSFFRSDFNEWQENRNSNPEKVLEVNYGRLLHSLDTAYSLRGRSLEISRPHAEHCVVVNLEATKDSLAPKKAREAHYLYVDPISLEAKTYEESYKIGEFLYRLHFFAQIPYPYGYYLSGFTALFFLFAIITGVLVHWKKIVSNFFVFRPKEKIKTLWTDAHTALGMIGLPFQFVYAVTGAFFMLNIFLVAPGVFTFYGGDREKLYDDLGYLHEHFEYRNTMLDAPQNIDSLAIKAKATFDAFRIGAVHIENYGDVSQHVLFEGSIPKSMRFNGLGEVTFDSGGRIVKKKDPHVASGYLETTKDMLYRIHYGDYAGYALKIAGFIMGLLTCLVILSGVMLWLSGRDKKKVDLRKKRFNERVVRIYLGICLSMFPVTALAFVWVKLRPDTSMTGLYTFYFLTWLVTTAIFILVSDYKKMLRLSLFSGGLLSVFLPILNGLVSHLWFWNITKSHLLRTAFVDSFWLVTGVVALFAFVKCGHKTTTGTQR